jgi:hypothetical protein
MKCRKIVTGGEGGFLYRVEKIKWLQREGLGRILLFGVPIRICRGGGRNRLAKECFAGLERFVMRADGIMVVTKLSRENFLGGNLEGRIHLVFPVEDAGTRRTGET